MIVHDSPVSEPYQAALGRNGLIRLKDHRQREQNGALQTARSVNHFVNQVTLDGMWPKWKCPWCEKEMSRLNVRIASGRRAWYLSRTVLICPHCERAVRHSKRKEAWLLLMLPLLLAPVFDASTDYATRIPVAV